MFALITLWSETDPIHQMREHPDFMSFAAEIGLVKEWARYSWSDRMPGTSIMS